GEDLVRRQGGHVNLVPVVKQLDRIGRASDRHASELAIKRLKQDRANVRGSIEDWKHELWAAKDEYKSTWWKSVFLFGLSAFVLVFAIVLLAVMREVMCLGFMVLSGSGVAMLI